MAKNQKTNVVLVTIAIFIATFMTAIEGTIVTTAMPTIIGSLHGMSLMNWVYSIYLLTSAMTTPIYGKLSDSYGRKPIFIFGLLIFIIGSTFCALSNSMMALIISRAIQGIGAGAIMPVSMTIIADIYPVEKRAQVMGLNGSAWGIASVVAPLLGGYIVEKLSWHWVFLINVPVGLLTIILVQVFLREQIVRVKTKSDFAGTVILMINLLALLYGCQVLGSNNVNWFMVGLCLIIVLLTLWLFMKVERRAPDPIISLSLFNNKTFVIVNIVTALVAGFLMAFEAYLPMWTQGVMGMKASMGGFAVTPSSLMWIVGSFLAGKLLVKYSPRLVLILSTAWLAVGAIILAITPVNAPFWFFLVLAAFLGLGFGTIITTTTVTAQESVPSKSVGVATSFNTLCRTLGQTIMVSICGIIFNVSRADALKAHPQVKESMIDQIINAKGARNFSTDTIKIIREILYTCIHNVYILAAGLVVVAFMFSWFGKERKTPLN